MATSEHMSEARRRDCAERNEKLFKEVNERLNEVREPSLVLGFLCECVRSECDEEISLTASEYVLLRAKPTSFAVKPGHLDQDGEAVGRQTERYWVVEGLGGDEDAATHYEPRTRATRTSRLEQETNGRRPR